MSEARQENDRSEATVVPVRRSDSFAETDQASVKRPRVGALLIGLSAVVLIAALFVVFAYLPNRVEQARMAEELAPEVPAETPLTPVEPELTAEQREAYRESAEEMLVQLLEQREELAALSAQSWGGAIWADYISEARMADDALLAEDLPEAVRLYEAALASGEQLFATSRRIMDDALAAGDEAIAAGNPELAMTQFDLVLAVDPDNGQALRGRQRAEALPGVLDAMRRGDEQRSAGDLEAAAAAYREALDIEPNWATARVAYDEVSANIAESRFESLISDGFAALDEGRFDGAIAAFNRAAALRPNSNAVRDGLAQAEQGQLLNSIVIAEVRGMAFERRELWDDAIARYREALEVDSTLSFAIDGLARAQRRADLKAKLDALIESPRLLLSEEVLQDAGNVLADALTIEDPGPIHVSQTEQLGGLIDLASTPIPITIVSDNATEVTVYRVGSLGSFASTELSLKPGQYTAVGSRRGYRDVRQPFTVLPGRANGPVTVVCVEPI